jgi:prepilin-type N-terminal cleavage/methylation domain-containing protein
MRSISTQVAGIRWVAARHGILQDFALLLQHVAGASGATILLTSCRELTYASSTELACAQAYNRSMQMDSRFTLQRSRGDIPLRPALVVAGARGFTLIEALLVIVIVGFVSTFALPKMAAIMTEQRLNRAAWALGNQVQVAFGLAMRNRKPIQITFDTSQAQLTIADRAGTVFTRTGLEAFNLNRSNVALSRSMVEVYPEGLAQDSLLITLSANSAGSTATRRVRMTRGGLVQIQ